MEEPFPATESQAKNAIGQSVRHSVQMVAVAKALIFERAKSSEFSDNLIQSVLTTHRAWAPTELFFHKQIDSTPGIRAVAEVFSWRIACAKAILSLIRSGRLLEMGTARISQPLHVGAFFGYPGSGGHRTSLIFSDLDIHVPQHVRQAPPPFESAEPLLSEPDLYLQDLRIDNLDESVRAALDEAVKCFRQDLFNAAATMLGSASEGGWLDLGASLIAAVPPADRADVKQHIKEIENFRNGVMRRIDGVIALYENQELFSTAALACGVKPGKLADVRSWSDTVRDSRNTIHVGHTPATPNTYDKVAELLLATPSNLRLLYKVKAAADPARTP
jgi:hypothetical protein